MVDFLAFNLDFVLQITAMKEKQVIAGDTGNFVFSLENRRTMLVSTLCNILTILFIKNW